MNTQPLELPDEVITGSDKLHLLCGFCNPQLQHPLIGLCGYLGSETFPTTEPGPKCSKCAKCKNCPSCGLYCAFE